MSWSFHPAREAFERYRNQWDAVNLAQKNHILTDSVFVSALLRHFGSPEVTLAINEDPRQSGMALLERKAPGIWETFQPIVAPLGPILFTSGSGATDGLFSLLRALPGYALQLGVMQQDPDHAGPAANAGHELVEKLDYIQTARIRLEGTFEQYWGDREGRVRKNNDRLRRRMAEKGLRLEFKVILDPSGVADAIRDLARLESAGWKAQEGTAVGADNVQGHFYREVLENLCARGEGAIYQLLIDGQVVATDICAVRGEMLVLLKTAYDEKASVYSPAFLLREDILRELYSAGRIRDYEFYGPLMDYQLRWTKDVRTLYHLTCFRHPWVRSARSVAKRMRAPQPEVAHATAPPESD